VAFDDDAAFAAFGQGFANRGDWRRNNINELVVEMRKRVRAVKPSVQFGISPFAVWRNKATDPAGSNTTAGCQTYDDLYADTRAWVQNEWIDYIAPQLYFYIGFPAADYAQLLPWWAETVQGTNVKLYIGEANYRVGAAGQTGPWQDPEELSRQLALSVATPQVAGHIYFSAKDVRADRLGAMKLIVDRFYNFTEVDEGAHAHAQKIALIRR
jgi:uncharacterized lipoprotein YddW (UPF0748 family)